MVRLIYSGTERYPMSNHTEAIGLTDFLQLLEEIGLFVAI
jgi:hypothetical protein